jgi:hypothetical protein
MTHDWFWCCWQAVWPERRPEILVLEDGCGPVAVIPLMRWRDRYHHLPVRCLGFLICPDTPTVDILTVGEPGPVMHAFLGHLVTRSDWDLVKLSKLPATSPTWKTLEAMLPGRLPWRQAATQLSPYLSIAGGWEGFYRGKTQRFRKTCRNIQNRLQRAGQVSVEDHPVVDPEGPLFCEVMEVARRSRKAERGLSMATMPKMPGFFRELTRRATHNGWLSLWLLRVDGRAIAMEYQLRTDGKVVALRADYDPEFRELSPGSALNFAIVQSLFQRGENLEYDMGPGTDEYKVRWATGTRQALAVELYSTSPYGRLLHGVKTRFAPFAGRLRDRVSEMVSTDSHQPSAPHPKMEAD